MGILERLKIAHKLPAAVVGSALVVGLGIGISAYFIGLNTVNTQRQQAMDASTLASVVQVNDYLKAVDIDLKLFAGRADTVQAMQNFTRSFSEMGANAASVMQNAYIAGNPNPEEDRMLLDTANGMGGSYDAQHKRYHDGFRSLLLERGYADVVMLDPAGDVIYSVVKQADFAMSVADGQPLADSGLGQVFRAAQGAKAGDIVFADFSVYAPAGGRPVAFVAMPIYKADALVGVMAMEIPARGLTDRVNAAKGLGETGEVMIVGADGLLRTNSKYDGQGAALETQFKAAPIDKALAGETAVGDGQYGDREVTLEARPLLLGEFEILMCFHAGAMFSDMRRHFRVLPAPEDVTGLMRLWISTFVTGARETLRDLHEGRAAPAMAREFEPA